MNHELRMYIWVFLLSCFFVVPSTHAAEVYFGTHEKEVNVGETFEVGVFLHTQGERINAVGGSIVGDKKLDIEEIRSGNTFVSLWVEAPHTTVSGTVAFSGIIPGGYQGGDGYLFSIIYKAKEAGALKIVSANEELLLNDGEGTRAQVTRAPIELVALDTGVVGTGFLPLADTEPPETFTPEIGQNEALFDNQWFVAFATHDKNAGIRSYEIFESQRRLSQRRVERGTFAWREAVSPAVLLDQGLHSFVYVKATDQAGNSRIVMVSPTYPLSWYEKMPKWSILLVGTLLISVIGGTLWFLVRAKRKKT